jgi:hypothetical protein
MMDRSATFGSGRINVTIRSKVRRRKRTADTFIAMAQLRTFLGDVFIYPILFINFFVDIRNIECPLSSFLAKYNFIWKIIVAKPINNIKSDTTFKRPPFSTIGPCAQQFLRLLSNQRCIFRDKRSRFFATL